MKLEAFPMIRRSILLTGVFCVWLTQSLMAGTTGKISGKVTDSNTGKPLPGVNVIVEGMGTGAATDASGDYYIINLPVGVYQLRFQMIGYQTVTVKDVRVRADLTTVVDMALNPTVLKAGKRVVVEAKRPLIQKDLTASRNIMTSEDIKNIPVQDVQDVVNFTAGFVNGHARGGRSGEVIYMVNGVGAVDPMNNRYEANIPESAVEEVSVYTGGFSAEYSNAQSGVVNFITKEGGPTYSGRIRLRTSALGPESGATGPDETRFFNFNDHHRLKDAEFAFGGPLPIKLMPLTFFVSGQYRDDNGRWPNDYNNLRSFTWKLVARPTKHDKLAFSGFLGHTDQGNYGHRYRMPTYENEDTDHDGHLDVTKVVLSTDSLQPGWLPIVPDWQGNDNTMKRWILVDVDGDGDFRNEDRNSNGKLDIADLNHDGDSTDALSMLDALELFNQNNSQFMVSWSHSISSSSYFDVQVSRYLTGMHYNVNERVNEDVNRNGQLDPGEDYNGNGKLDPYGWDLLTDWNDDGYIDASQYPGWDPNKPIDEWGPMSPDSTWMPWEDVEIGNGLQDAHKLYMYGDGKNFYRLRWNTDQKVVWNIKTTYTSQWNKRNKMKVGAELSTYNIFDHDVDLASGGNVYGQNIGYIPGHGEKGQKPLRPKVAGAFIENKMEYEGMIVNAGLRFDYFDPATNMYRVNELEEISDTLEVKPKYYISPRLGIAHPITERDVFYFNYGQYFQIPVFRLLYENLNWDLSGAFPRVGNPDLQPERTTSYEIGVRHQFTEDLAVDAKGFYKDISGLTSTRQVYYSASNYYTIYFNTDYGNVRGFEITFEKRYTRYLGGYLSYSYSVAKGKASSPTEAYVQTWAHQIVPKKEQYLDWDQRHTVNAVVNFGIPFIGLNGNFTANYGSGLPYTPPSYSLDVPLNTKRRPATFMSDLYLAKRLKLKGEGSLEFFLWVNNVLNNKNVTGIADVQWWENYTQIQKHYDAHDSKFFGSEDDNNGIDDDGDGFIDETIRDEYMMLMDTDGDGKVDDNKKYPAGGQYSYPGYYSEPRTWRLGVAFEF